MADVARLQAVGGAARSSSRHQNGHTPTPRRSRSGHYSNDIQYAMDFIVQPPRSARVGHTIPGSIIVRLRTTNTYPDDAVVDSPNLMAVAALVPGPSSTASSDPNVLNTLLAGHRIDSIHPFADDEADGSIASMDMAGSQGVGYMRFPDLAVRQAGTYRIRITLLRFGSAVQVVDSSPVVVQNAGPATAYASYNGRYPVASY
ncbi:hypothetical protein ST47_g6574 [Ascochyta rabiei]|uniref:Uncharacterized protein n=2 Tax=Didymella rabiei TaxID=5454 RepID=A0A163C9X0_DIDRA|nr:hypothetical protein ST47_g6574 [Ascochyta rabiei]